MIKRQLYRLEHPNNDDDGASDGSSSSSDEDSEPTHDPSTEEEEAAAAGDAVESPGSGYQSEDSSYRDRELNNSEVWPNQLTSDEDEDLEPCRDVLKQNSSSKLEHDRVNKTIAISQSKLSNQWAEAVDETEKDRALDDLDDCVIKCKSVFRCKLCPRIVCLSQDTMRVHLDSKRHARSQKLYAEGRLKLMLNSDGEVEEDAETHAERHARIVATVQQVKNSRKRSRGRQRQKQRAKKKKTCVTGNMKAQGKQSSGVNKNKNNAGKDKHHQGI